MKIIKFYRSPNPGDAGAPPAGLPNVDTNPELLKDINDASAMNGLPNLDTVIDKHAGTPPPAASKPGEPGNDGKGTPGTPGDFMVETFNHFKETFGENFQIPKDVTKETFLDKVFETLYPAFEQSLSPQAVHLHNYLSNGGTMDDYVKQFGSVADYSKMKPEDKLISYYLRTIGKSETNPDGLDETAIKDYVSKMDQITKLEKARQAEIELKKIDDSENQKVLLHLQNQNREKQAKNITKLKDSAQKTIESLGEVKDVFGIPVTSDEVKRFNEEFPQLITPDEKGVAPIHKLIYDNQLLYKLLFVASKAGDIQDIFNSAANQNTRDLKDKLSGKPPAYQSNKKPNAMTIDYDALSRPAQD